MPDYQKAIDAELVRLELAYGFDARFITANYRDGNVVTMENEDGPVSLSAINVLEALQSLPAHTNYDAAWVAILEA